MLMMKEMKLKSPLLKMSQLGTISRGKSSSCLSQKSLSEIQEREEAQRKIRYLPKKNSHKMRESLNSNKISMQSSATIFISHKLKSNSSPCLERGS